jgi:hypothetical protein
MQLKNRFVVPVVEENPEVEWKKFDILVEALWEVVKDYIDKDENY